MAQVLGFANHYLCKAPVWVSSQAEAELLGATRKRATVDKLALAGLVYFGSRMLWGSFLSWVLQQLQSGKLRGILLMSYILIDETTLPLRMYELLNLCLSQQKHHSKRRAKIVQAEFHLNMVVIGSLTKNEYTLVRGELPCKLGVVDTTTSETLEAYIVDTTHIPMVRLLTEYFAFKIDGATSDRAGYLERLWKVRSSQHIDAAPFYEPCDIHCCSIAIGSGAKLVNSDIDGSRQFTTSFSEYGGGNDFRGHLEDSLVALIDSFPSAQRLPPDHPATYHRTELLDLLLPDAEPGAKQRKVILNKLLGDIRGPRIMVYGVNEDKQTIAKAVAEAMFPHSMKKLLQHRWYTSRTTLAELALLFNIGDSGKNHHSVGRRQKLQGRRLRQVAIHGRRHSAGPASASSR